MRLDGTYGFLPTGATPQFSDSLTDQHNFQASLRSFTLFSEASAVCMRTGSFSAQPVNCIIPLLVRRKTAFSPQYTFIAEIATNKLIIEEKVRPADPSYCHNHETVSAVTWAVREVLGFSERQLQKIQFQLEESHTFAILLKKIIDRSFRQLLSL